MSAGFGPFRLVYRAVAPSRLVFFRSRFVFFSEERSKTESCQSFGQCGGKHMGQKRAYHHNQQMELHSEFLFFQFWIKHVFDALLNNTGKPLAKAFNGSKQTAKKGEFSSKMFSLAIILTTWSIIQELSHQHTILKIFVKSYFHFFNHTAAKSENPDQNFRRKSKKSHIFVLLRIISLAERHPIHLHG